MKTFIIVLLLVYFLYQQQQKENFKVWTAINSFKYKGKDYGDLEN